MTQTVEPPSVNTEPDPKPESATVEELSAAELVAVELAATRRRWPALLVGLALGAAAAYGAITYLDRANEDDEVQAETVQLATAPVEARDLSEEVEWTGTLQFGAPVTISGTGGTVTAAAPAGQELRRGDVVVSVDGEPVPVLYGQRPLFRTLRDGVEGVDVLLLETNLVALGYDPDVTVSVDNEFTANTELMVERWQEDLGREITGQVEVSDVALIPGPSVITTEAIVGSNAGDALATLSSQRTVTDVTALAAGLLTDPLAIGTEIVHGSELFAINDVPVVAVTAAEIDADPVLAELTDATFTDLELEEALAAAGHDPDGEMTVDGAITIATTAAIERWQAAAGLPVTGIAAPAYYLPMPLGQTVDAHLIGTDPETDGTVSASRPVLTASASELLVEVEVGVADADEFVVGQSVSIELADEQVIDGVVAEIGQVQRANPQADPIVTIGIDVIADADQNLVEGTANVTTISESIEGATAVPTRALVSLAEGGFAVEVVADDGSTGLVGVELGAFDEGYVQVIDGDVAPGDEVVVPQ